MPEHTHVWSGRLFSDGCHFYSNSYACECGAAMTISGERQMVSRGVIQPGAMMAGDDCLRCDDLIAGAKRKPTQRHVLEPGEREWKRVRLHG